MIHDLSSRDVRRKLGVSGLKRLKGQQSRTAAMLSFVFLDKCLSRTFRR